MSVRLPLIALAVAIAAAGCQSESQQVSSMQGEAAHVAQRRAAFEMNCPGATAQVISSEMIQSPVMNPRFAPPMRAEYTVGVAGCNQRATYLVICAVDGTGCFAGGTRNEIR
jgi:hypothetical protein